MRRGEGIRRPLRRFAALYIQLLLPFLTGFAFAVFVLRTDYAWHWYAAAGLALVIIGPLTIRFLLMLLAEALRGGPGIDERNSRASATSVGLRSTTGPGRRT